MSAAALASARTLHLVDHQGVGGVQRAMIELVRHERMDGAGDEIVLVERALDIDRDFAAPATPVHFLGLGDPDPRTLASRLRELATSRGARVLQAHSASALALLSTAQAAGLRTLATLHEAPAELTWAARRRRRRVLRALDRFYVSTPALVEAWERAGRKPEVLPLAVDVQRFHPGSEPSAWRASRLPDPETLLVGSLMGAVDGKRDEILCEAVVKRHAAGRPTALMLVGNGPRFERRRELARTSDRIHIRRRVQDVTSWMAMIDVFALHADAELVPMSLLEALSCGRPAVVADRGSVAEFVPSEIVDYVGVGDVDGLVGVLDRLADEDVRLERARAGRQHVLEHHALSVARGVLGPHYG